MLNANRSLLYAGVALATAITGLELGAAVYQMDFSDCEKNLAGVVRTDAGKVDLQTEESSWNKCARLTLPEPTTNAAGVLRFNAGMWIGGRKGDKSFGFGVRPSTEYEISFEVRGTAQKVAFHLDGWEDDAGWKDRKRLTTSLRKLPATADWTVVRGTFKTGPLTRRAALLVKLFWDSPVGTPPYKGGETVSVDNVKVVESKRNLTSDPSSADEPIVTRKAFCVGRGKGSVVIDGRADEAAWREASEFSDFVDLRTQSAFPVKTTVKAVLDETGLCFLLTAEEPEKVSVGEPGRSRSDTLEIWFGPQDGKPFAQFSVSPNGDRFARFGQKTIDPEKWDVAPFVAEDRWGAEVRIPLAVIGLTPTAGLAVPFNVGRGRFAIRKYGPKYATWSPLLGGFNTVKDFGTLVFGNWSAALVRAYGDESGAADRATYERKVAEHEKAKTEAEMARFRSKGFSVAPIPVCSDYAVPFLPPEIFNPPTNIALVAARNEKKPLVVAVANLTEAPAEYRVFLETPVGGPLGTESGVRRYVGQRGLEGFPAGQIAFRHALRVKDTNAEPVVLRLDPLPLMDQASVISVPPHEAGVVVFDFDTHGVDAGVYRGRLHVTPLGMAGKLVRGKGGYHDITFEDKDQILPVELEVLSDELETRLKRPFGFFQWAENKSMFDLMIDMGVEEFQLSPFSFRFPVNGNGDLETADYPRRAEVQSCIRNHRIWAQPLGFRPRWFIGFSTFNSFVRMYGDKNDPERANRLWPKWLAAVAEVLASEGVRPDEWTVETFDEPRPEDFERMLQCHRAAKTAVPTVRLDLTLANRPYALFSRKQLEALAETTASWNPNRYSPYFGNATKERYWDFFLGEKAKGKTLWHYSCSTSMREVLDRNFRKHVWFTEGNALSGSRFYIFVKGAGGYGAADWRQPARGDVIYRVFDEFLPSLRYLALREGVTDMRYLELLRRRAGDDEAARSFLDATLKTGLQDNNNGTAAAERFRLRAIEMLRKGREL